MTYKTIFFDLDDTIYPSTSGLWPAIGQRIDMFIHEKVGLLPEEIRGFRSNLYKEYGTTMRGLKILYDINEKEYLKYVHDIPLENYIQPDKELRQVLNQYPQDKWIFTNADMDHAKRVLDVVGLGECFNGIIDILQLSPYCKPQPEAYQIALKVAGVMDPKECVFIDDREMNLDPARHMGFFTILIDELSRNNNNHVKIQSLKYLSDILITS